MLDVRLWNLRKKSWRILTGLSRHDLERIHESRMPAAVRRRERGLYTAEELT